MNIPNPAFCLSAAQKDRGYLPVITMCGSVKYAVEAVLAENALVGAGWCPIGYTTPLTLLGRDENLDDDMKKRFDDVHDKKIRMSDAIYVVNKDGYIGKSTRREIDYAKSIGKYIYYMEDDQADSQ